MVNNFIASCESQRDNSVGHRSAISAQKVLSNCFQDKKNSMIIPKSPMSHNLMNRQNSYRSNSNNKSARSHLSALSNNKRDQVVMVPLSEEVIRKEMLSAFNNIKLDCYNDFLRIKKP